MRVANVAREAGDTKPRDYRLKVTLVPQNGATCTFEGTHSWSNPLSSDQEPIAGTAKIAGAPGDEVLLLYSDQPSLDESMDLSGLVFGAGPGFVQVPTHPHRQARLQLLENSDPSDLQAIREERQTPMDILDSGVSTIERMAMLRLRGNFVLENQGRNASSRVEGRFDAGYGLYHCERGVEMQRQAVDRVLRHIIDPQAPDEELQRALDSVRDLLERD